MTDRRRGYFTKTLNLKSLETSAHARGASLAGAVPGSRYNSRDSVILCGCQDSSNKNWCSIGLSPFGFLAKISGRGRDEEARLMRSSTGEQQTWLTADCRTGPTTVCRRFQIFGVKSMLEKFCPIFIKSKFLFPRSPEILNSYVIKDAERHLIIDTGWNQEECLKAMQAGLRKLGWIYEKRTFLLLTSCRSFWPPLKPRDRTSKIYSPADANRFRAFPVGRFRSLCPLNGYLRAN